MTADDVETELLAWSHVPLVATVIVDKKYARTSINMFKIKKVSL